MSLLFFVVGISGNITAFSRTADEGDGAWFYRTRLGNTTNPVVREGGLPTDRSRGLVFTLSAINVCKLEHLRRDSPATSSPIALFMPNEGALAEQCSGAVLAGRIAKAYAPEYIDETARVLSNLCVFRAVHVTENVKSRVVATSRIVALRPPAASISGYSVTHLNERVPVDIEL